jgi:hypothetical protein
MSQMKRVRIQKPKPRRQVPVGAEDAANVIRDAKAATARARDLSDRLRALAHDLEIALGHAA